jgi:hypothetical protein
LTVSNEPLKLGVRAMEPLPCQVSLVREQLLPLHQQLQMS